MIVTTTDGVEGRKIAQYLGIVTGEAVMGTNVFADFFGAIRDFVGGRSGTYQKVLAKAKEEAMADLIATAEELGADAVVGIDLDYEVIGGDEKTMLFCVANGTAVKLG